MFNWSLLNRRESIRIKSLRTIKISIKIGIKTKRNSFFLVKHGPWRTATDLIVIALHAAHFSQLPLLVQFLFGLLFERADVLHREAVPLIDPAEHLSSKFNKKMSRASTKGPRVNKAKPVERGEEPTLWLLNKVLDATLQTEPLKFACDQFVARHHRLHLLPPFGPDQRTSAGFRRLEPWDKKPIC